MASSKLLAASLCTMSPLLVLKPLRSADESTAFPFAEAAAPPPQPERATPNETRTAPEKTRVISRTPSQCLRQVERRGPRWKRSAEARRSSLLLALLFVLGIVARRFLLRGALGLLLLRRDDVRLAAYLQRIGPFLQRAVHPRRRAAKLVDEVELRLVVLREPFLARAAELVEVLVGHGVVEAGLERPARRLLLRFRCLVERGVVSLPELRVLLDGVGDRRCAEFLHEG